MLAAQAVAMSLTQVEYRVLGPNGINISLFIGIWSSSETSHILHVSIAEHLNYNVALATLYRRFS